MKKINIGDEVRIVFKNVNEVKHVCGKIKNYDVGIVVDKNNKEYLVNFPQYKGFYCFEEELELIEDTTPQKYEFTISHPNLLDFEEISNELTRENPVAIVHIGSSDVNMIVHRSIILKNRVFCSDYPTSELSNRNILIKLNKNDIKDMINRIKKIKKSMYYKGKLYKNITVAFPKI
jgi:hypothetical protein